MKQLWIMTGLLLANVCVAGPPFLTDDPYPADYKQWQIYFFGTGNLVHQGFDLAIPALQINYGIIPHLEFSLLLPGGLSIAQSTDEMSNFGLGDVQFNFKYAFIRENDFHPSFAIVPTLFIPTGNADKGLGNGRMMQSIPLWIGKTWEKIQTYGGGGYTFNSAPGMENFWFGGWVVQVNLTADLMLGGEIFLNSPQEKDSSSSIVINAGGSYNLSKYFSMLFSLGHSLQGENQYIGYIGLLYSS